jgi:asparagine synthetase B (glutamine-hydrolysing)
MSKAMYDPPRGTTDSTGGERSELGAPRIGVLAVMDGYRVTGPADTSVREGRSLDPFSRLDLDLQTYLPGDILTKLDRMSVAISLEARVPLLDHPLVEFACALPPGLRMRGSKGKYILKRVLRGRIPDTVLTRPKRGFGVPLEIRFSHTIGRSRGKKRRCTCPARSL